MIFVAEPGACDLCGPLDKMAIPIDKVEKGVNMFPMHPNCRCSSYGHIKMDYKKGGSTLDREVVNGVWGEDANNLQLRQARKAGNKVWITNQAIEKVQFINIPGYSQKENKDIQLFHKQLLDETAQKNNSNELMYILYGNNPVKVFGNQFGVNVNESVNARIALNSSEKRSLTVLHNHPGGSTFSLNDFNFFMGTPSVKTLTIVTNTGRVMYVTKTDSFDFAGAVKKLSDLEINNDDYVEKAFRKLYNYGVRYKLK